MFKRLRYLYHLVVYGYKPLGFITVLCGLIGLLVYPELKAKGIWFIMRVFLEGAPGYIALSIIGYVFFSHTVKEHFRIFHDDYIHNENLKDPVYRARLKREREELERKYRAVRAIRLREERSRQREEEKQETEARRRRYVMEERMRASRPEPLTVRQQILKSQEEKKNTIGETNNDIFDGAEL